MTSGLKIIQIFYLFVFCVMVVLSPHILGSMSEWLNDQSFEQHPLIEFDQEILLFAFFVLIAIGAKAGPMRPAHQPICAIYLSPQFPPPK